jgi:hypothetical protein
MTNVRSWKFWVIIALALTTLACAGRRERREQAREDRRDRAEERRAQRAERSEPRRADRASDEGNGTSQSRPAAQSNTQGATFQPISTAPTAAAGDSTIMIIRVASARGGLVMNAVAASIFDVTDEGRPKVVGTLRGSSKVAYPVKPGRYTFMVISEAADFMLVDVIGGKTYYAMVMQRTGVIKARFSFRPVRGTEVGGKQFTSWDNRAQLVEITPDQVAWAENNAAEIADKRARYWPEWSAKSQAERNSQTLRAEDGR